MKISTIPFSHTVGHLKSHTAKRVKTFVIQGFVTPSFGCNPRPICKYCPAPFSQQLNKSIYHCSKKEKVEQNKYCENKKYYYTSIIVFNNIEQRNPLW